MKGGAQKVDVRQGSIHQEGVGADTGSGSGRMEQIVSRWHSAQRAFVHHHNHPPNNWRNDVPRVGLVNGVAVYAPGKVDQVRTADDGCVSPG